MNRNEESVKALMCLFFTAICGKKIEELKGMMYPDIVWICNEYEHIIFGAEEVCHILKDTIPAAFDCVGDSYSELYQEENCCVAVCAFRVREIPIREGKGAILVYMTAFWMDLKTNPRLKHIHLSYTRGHPLFDTILRRKKKEKTLYKIKDRENSTYCLKDADIFYVESRKNYLVWHCRGIDITIRGTMSYYQRYLSSSFLRIHRSYMVNIKYVERIWRCALKMANGDELQIPVRRYCSVKEKIPARPLRIPAGEKKQPKPWSEDMNISQSLI